jgi:predicted DNA-binding transcriptional regulator
MSKDQVLGSLILLGSIAGIAVYVWLLFLTPYAMVVLQLTALIAVGAVLAILAWIGYTLATTPPPKPIEDIEKELKKLEEESTQEAES